MTPIQWIVAVIGTGGVGKFLWDFVTVLTQRKKSDTENVVILLNSATGYSSKLETRLDAVTQDFDEFRKEQSKFNRENDQRWRKQDQLLVAHSHWDHRVVEQLKAKGIRIEDPPPLFLPIVTEGT